MNLTSSKASNNGVLIHYLDSINDADTNLAPVVICPGLSETAEEYIELSSFLLPRRVIALSFRGRGHSDTPHSGYHLQAHVSDIEAVVRATGISQFHLVANSRGVSYALAYSKEHNEHVKTLSVLDYPSEHRAMDEGWADDYIYNYLIPYKRLNINIREAAVRGIQVDSRYEDISFDYLKPLLVIRGLLAGSLITNEDLECYKIKFPQLTLVECNNSAHNIRNTEQEKVFNAIKEFITKKD